MQTAYKTYDDGRLVLLLSSGDEMAFAEIYHRYSRLLFSYAFNILKHTGGAEDAVQEIFLSIWKRRSEMAHIRSIGGYLTQSIRYYVLRVLKEEKRDNAFFTRLSAITEEIESINPALFSELQQVLNKLINGLPEDHQLIYRLNREEGYTYQEIANNLNISVKTVEKKMSKTLQHLRLGMSEVLVIAIFVGERFN